VWLVAFGAVSVMFVLAEIALRSPPPWGGLLGIAVGAAIVPVGFGVGWLVVAAETEDAAGRR
jgi:xanthosine utilization system XapX-like protein